MRTPDCYTTALYVGIPLVILSWLGQLSIYLTYKLLKKYVTQTDKRSEQEKREEYNLIEQPQESQDDGSSGSSDEPSLQQSTSSKSVDSPRIIKISPRDTICEPSTVVPPGNADSSKLSTPVVVVPATNNVQQELAGRNLSIDALNQNILTLAPLAKQKLEESNLPESQKQLLLNIFNLMNPTRNTSSSDDISSLSNQMNSIKQFQLLLPVLPVEQGSLLDD